MATGRVYFGVPETGGSPITGFQIQWKEPGDQWATTRQATALRSPHDIAGLDEDGTYEFRVRAVNRVGQGLWSPDIAVTFPTDAGSITSAVVHFGEPDEGGAAILDYRVQWRALSQDWSGGREMTVTTSPVEITGLVPERSYEFRVRARNRVGEGVWSVPVAFTMPARPRSPAPGSFAGVGSGTSVAWSWDAVDGASEYELETRQGAEGVWTRISLGNVTARTTTGHTAGTAVQGRVRAIAVEVEGRLAGAWAEATAAIVPAAPTLMGAGAADAITLSWDAPDDGGGAITGYVLQYREVGETAWTVQNRTAAQRSFVIADAAGDYEAQVAARNVAGSGPASDIGTFSGYPDLEGSIAGLDEVTIPGSVRLQANATGGPGNYTYLWNTGATSQSITEKPTRTTTYTCTITSGRESIALSHTVVVYEIVSRGRNTSMQTSRVVSRQTTRDTLKPTTWDTQWETSRITSLSGRRQTTVAGSRTTRWSVSRTTRWTETVQRSRQTTKSRARITSWSVSYTTSWN